MTELLGYVKDVVSVFSAPLEVGFGIMIAFAILTKTIALARQQ
ncbi:hypothetical protein [Brevibacillus laterosporus]